MGAPKGHKPYGGETGGQYGYLGKPQDAYTEEDLIKLGKELVDYMREPRSIWYKGFCTRKGMRRNHFEYLKATYPIFAEYVEHAHEIQEEKLNTHAFWKEADGFHARFLLERFHKDYKLDPIQANNNADYNVNYDSNPEQVLPEKLPIANPKVTRRGH